VLPGEERRMKVRFTFLLAVAACVSGSTEKDVEEGRDAFLSCLRGELASKLALRMDPEDFVLSVKGACTREVDRFVDTFIDYMWSRFPTIDAADHIAMAREALDGWRAEAARSYADTLRKSGN
jgi:hypothetical protein